MKIRQEINILNSILEAGASAQTSGEIGRLNAGKFNTTIACYFEIIVKTSVSLTSTIRLRRRGTSTDDKTIAVPLTTTAYTRLRSTSFTPPAGTTEYVVVNDGSGSGTVSIKSARIIIIQTATGIYGTESQIEIGNKEICFNTVAAGLANPKYWHYDSAKYDADIQFIADVFYKMETSQNKSTIKLQEDDGAFGSWTDKVTLLNNWYSTTIARAKARFTPVSGRNYRLNVVTTVPTITFVNYGAMENVRNGDLEDIGIPAGIANNDILVCCLHSRDNVVSTMPGDWTLKVSGNGNADNRLQVWWKRTTGTETAPTVTHAAGNSAIAQIYAFRGCKQSGDPFDVVGSVQSNAGTPISTTQVTTVKAKCMILHLFGSQDNNTWSTFTGSATTLAAQNANTSGSDDSEGLAYDILTAVGASGVAGAVQSALCPDSGVSVLMALAPPAGLYIYNSKIIIEEFVGEEKSLYNLGSSNFYGDGGTIEAVGQSFVPSSSFNLDSIILGIYKYGSPIDGVKVELAATIGGAAIATSNTIPASSLNTSSYDSSRLFYFSTKPALTSGVTYYFRLVRTGARDTSNYYYYLTGAYANGTRYKKESGVWSSWTGDMFFFICAVATTLTKTERQYLLLNTGSVVTGQNDFDTYFDPAEWAGVLNAYYHEHNASGAGSNTKLQYNGSDIADSSITGANRQRGSAMTMPDSAQKIDVNIITASTIYSDKIIVLVSPPVAAAGRSFGIVIGI